MPQSLAQIYLHLVFSTKERFPFLRILIFAPKRTTMWEGSATTRAAQFWLLAAWRITFISSAVLVDPFRSLI